MYEACLAKQEGVKTIFATCKTPTETYEKIIGLGRVMNLFPEEWKTAEHLVEGCQGRVYLRTEFVDGRLRFAIGAEALISTGLAALLIAVYNNEPPEVILGCPPAFLEALGIHRALTPGRSHGLSSIHLRMKQEAAKFLVAV